MLKKTEFRVLLVEDNPDHVHIIKKTIERAKRGTYRVEHVQTVEKAMEFLSQDNFSIIVTDFNLPGKSGLDLLHWLNEKGRKIPLIMLTGSGDEKTAVKALQEGAYNYVVKDDMYTQVIPHVIEEALLRYFSLEEKERLEREIREKNVELEKANRQLKKLDRLKSDFISNVSHEVRTPLNAVKESISLILEGVVSPKEEKGARVLEIAQRNIERLTSMINDMLDFSKIEAGKLRLHFEMCDLQVLIDEVLLAFRALAESKKVKLEFVPKEEFPQVYADPERAVQVLSNLISNALKYSTESGLITVQCELIPDQMAKITIADKGIGIPKEDLVRIFGRFEQSGNAQRIETGNRGTGLGLAICHELIKMHHGEIWAESELGKGSRFMFTLPLTVSSYEQHTSPMANLVERT